MAVSYRIVMFLIALTVFGMLYGFLQMPVDLLHEIALDFSDGENTADAVENIYMAWLFAPVIALIAAGAWLLKQGVIVNDL